MYRYDVPMGQSTLYRRPEVAFSPDDYESAQVFYASKDGTQIPMFITHRKGLTLDGSNPTYLYGYGGFDISLTPSFSPAQIVWMEMGGILAVPNLRGGGEYGAEWHEAGIKEKKQSVFDDFISAAEWLIANNYTSAPKLAIGGGSNGGLLVGACLTQRPDLFGACLPAVGVLDMLRFQKFTIGWAWTSDYGSADNAADFPYLLRLLPPAHAETRHVLPRDPDYHRRPRRPCRPRPLVQVRRRLAGRAGRPRPDPHPHRDPRRPRRRQAHRQSHRRSRRPLGVFSPSAGNGKLKRSVGTEWN